jgi:EF hand domain-containing protein
MCHLPIYPTPRRPLFPFPTPRPFDGSGCSWLNRDRRYHGNLPDSNVGQRGWRCFPFVRHQRTDGWGIDLNNNGRYDRGRDGVLVFDTNRDGKYDKRDVSGTNAMMKAASGNYDFNGDGRVTCFERARGRALKNQFRQFDRNGNGRLESWEISQGGGKVWVDRSRNGKINCGELHSPYRLPGGLFERGRTLDHVDPVWGSRTSTNSPWWERPRCGHRPYIRPCIGFGRTSY